MKKDYRILLDAVLIRKTEYEKENLNKLILSKCNWCEIAGQIINHRLGGYFIKGMNDRLEIIPKELREALKLMFFAQKKNNERIITEIEPILEIFEKSKIRYAGLKGIQFSADIYDLGDRRCNDTDLLIHENDISKTDQILREHGYIQNTLPNGELEEATKREKLIQRLNYYNLIPYMKKTDYGISEIDINFLFDSKDNVIDDEIFDYGTIIYKGNDYSIRGLPFYTNLAYLCVQFHREATSTLWTINRKDVVLYKVADLMNTIRAHRNEWIFDEWIAFMKKLNLQNKCYFTFYILSQFYHDSIIRYIEKALRQDDISFVDEISVVGENRKIKRSEKFIKSAFNHIH